MENVVGNYCRLDSLQLFCCIVTLNPPLLLHIPSFFTSEMSNSFALNYIAADLYD